MYLPNEYDIFFDYEPLAAASIGQGNRLNCIKCFFFLQPIVLMVLFSVVREAGTEEK